MPRQALVNDSTYLLKHSSLKTRADLTYLLELSATERLLGAPREGRRGGNDRLDRE